MKDYSTVFKGILTAFLILFLEHPLQGQISPTEHHATPRFEKIEQPLSLKLTITALGFGLIGLELWWFLFSSRRPKS